MTDIVLWAIVGLFVAWEAFAHFIAKNREAHTLSNRIWALERRWPVTRLVVAAAVALLGTHLVAGFP